MLFKPINYGAYAIVPPVLEDLLLEPQSKDSRTRSANRAILQLDNAVVETRAHPWPDGVKGYTLHPGRFTLKLGQHGETPALCGQNLPASVSLFPRPRFELICGSFNAQNN